MLFHFNIVNCTDMFSLLGFGLLFAAHGVVAENKFLEAEEVCKVLDYKKYVRCCDKVDTINFKNDEFKDMCQSEEDGSCEKLECFLTAAEIMKDGMIDGEKLKEKQEKFVEEYSWAKDTAQTITAECTQEKLDKFPAEYCTAKKFEICVFINSVLTCNAWKTDSECEGLAEKVPECKAAVDKMKDEW